MWRLFGRDSDAARAQIRPTRPRPFQTETAPAPAFDIVGLDPITGKTHVLEYGCPGVRGAQRRIDHLQPLHPALLVWMRRCA